jgi:hypothetical protein
VSPAVNEFEKVNEAPSVVWYAVGRDPPPTPLVRVPRPPTFRSADAFVPPPTSRVTPLPDTE